MCQDVTSAKLFSDEAASMFERATSSTLKDSMLLYFAYADFEEGRVKYDRVHQIYQRFLELDNIDPTLVSLFNHLSFCLLSPILVVLR